MLKKEKGITLVALIVTIIILLFLAGFILTITLKSNDIIEDKQDNGTVQVNEAENIQTEE